MGVRPPLQSWRRQRSSVLAGLLHLSRTPSLLWSRTLFAPSSVSLSPLSYDFKSLGAEVLLQTARGIIGVLEWSALPTPPSPFTHPPRCRFTEA